MTQVLTKKFIGKPSKEILIDKKLLRPKIFRDLSQYRNQQKNANVFHSFESLIREFQAH